jgi:hypothetical protein
VRFRRMVDLRRSSVAPHASMHFLPRRKFLRFFNPIGDGCFIASF